jgi:hypothetical protein
MRANVMHAVVRLAGIAAIAALLGAGVAVAADQGAKPADDGYRHATMLGGPRSLIGPLRDLAAVKRAITRPAVRKGVEGVIDTAGLSAAVKEEILKILVAADASQMKAGKFEVGNTWVWMGLKNAGKPEIIRNVRWSGSKPFDAWFFDIDDGETLYHFMLPKACGNLTLVSSERRHARRPRCEDTRAVGVDLTDGHPRDERLFVQVRPRTAGELPARRNAQ